MAERRDADREVLTSLPRSRPARRSGKRADRPEAGSGAAPAKSRATKATASATKSKTKAKPKTARDAKPKSARATKPVATAGAKAAADVKLAAGATKPKAAPKSGERPRSTPRRKVPPAGYAAPRSDDSVAADTADVLGTTIQAAAELAQIGLTVGRQTLRSMLDRLPKP